MGKLPFRFVKIEACGMDTASFETTFISRLLQEKPIGAGAKKRAETSFGGVITAKKILFNQAREEFLCEILSVLRTEFPSQSDILIYRFSVSCRDGVERPRFFRVVFTLYRGDDRVPGSGKTSSW